MHFILISYSHSQDLCFSFLLSYCISFHFSFRIQLKMLFVTWNNTCHLQLHQVVLAGERTLKLLCFTFPLFYPISQLSYSFTCDNIYIMFCNHSLFSIIQVDSRTLKQNGSIITIVFTVKPSAIQIIPNMFHFYSPVALSRRNFLRLKFKQIFPFLYPNC